MKENTEQSNARDFGPLSPVLDILLSHNGVLPTLNGSFARRQERSKAT